VLLRNLTLEASLPNRLLHHHSAKYSKQKYVDKNNDDELLTSVAMKKKKRNQRPNSYLREVQQKGINVVDSQQLSLHIAWLVHVALAKTALKTLKNKNN